MHANFVNGHSYRPNSVNTPFLRVAMLANESVACQRMLPRLGSIAAALLLASALMAEIPEHLRYATLPKQWQQALDTFRDKPSARGGAAKPFTQDEDACILHYRHELGSTKRVAWAKMLPTRNGTAAAKSRYMD